MICANKMHALSNNAAPSEVICSLKDFSPKCIKHYSEEPQIFVQVFKRSHSKLSLLMYINQFFICINLCMCLCEWMWDVLPHHICGSQRTILVVTGLCFLPCLRQGLYCLLLHMSTYARYVAGPRLSGDTTVSTSHLPIVILKLQKLDTTPNFPWVLETWTQIFMLV